MPKTIVFTFGRLSPPTIGHQKLMTKVVEVARSRRADHAVYLSQSHDAIRNPLEWDFKRRVCEAAFKGVNISHDTSIRSPFIALNSFIGLYENAVLVVGQDQVSEFEDRMLEYAGLNGINLEVTSAGNRIDEAEGVEGISGTKMRQYALEGKKALFLENLPTTLNMNIKNLVYRNIIKGMKTR